MNGTAKKTAARDIRRAFGPVALDAISQHGASIETLRFEIVALRDAINAERTHRLKLADEQRSYVDRGDKLTDAKVDTFLRRGFWRRLNWLLRGQ